VAEPVRTIDVGERRARLARRHRLAPTQRAATVAEAAGSLVALHGTDQPTIYLSAWARVDGLRVADVDRALYDDRSLVKHLAMRRTLWVVPRDLLAVVQGAASDRVAATERKRLVAEVEKAGLHADGARWLAEAGDAVLATLADGRERTSTQLRAEIPLLEGSMTYGEGRTWGGQVAVGPRVLTVLSASGDVVRASNGGSWTVSRPSWTTMSAWLGAEVPSLPADDALVALVALVERWLRAFGPGTEADIRWWIKAPVTAVRRALATLGAVPVGLGDDAGTLGYVLPDDVDPVEPVEPWVALLPPLDPTTMGWTERAWYLGPYQSLLFDTAGNAGPTVWVNGRIVGGWRQHDTGEVELQLLEPVDRAAADALDRRAAELTDWFGGKRVLMRFPSPLSRQRGS
jgi:hypothetical protein